MNKPDCNITRKFLKREKGPADKIRRFLEKKHASRKHAITRKGLASNDIADIMPTPPALVETPIDEDIHRIVRTPSKDNTNKLYTRRIQRFMKTIDPNKRRSRYLNGVCSDSGVCIAFGKQVKTIHKHFDGFVKFDHAKSLRKIGTVSANGFVKEIEYENAGYTSHAVLKSTTKLTADNLYYEYLVGLFLNEQSKYSPIFLETYGFFSYNSELEYENMKNPTATKDDLVGLTKIGTPNDPKSTPFLQFVADKKTIARSCANSKHLCVLIQHIKSAETLAEKCSKNTSFVKTDLMFVLFQIYHTLYLLNETFTHNDLHTDNVLVYEPVKDGYIQYYYHTTTGTVRAFKSAYIPKIIDYGRCFYDFKRPYHKLEILNSSRTIYKMVCDVKVCDPYCGYTKGYKWLKPSTQTISAHDPNMSKDLRLLKMLQSAETDFGGYYNMQMCKNIKTHNPILHNILNTQLVYNTKFFTPQNTNIGTNLTDPKINNVFDAYTVFASEIDNPILIAKNEAKYAGHNKIGEMHVYEDRPLEFISA